MMEKKQCSQCKEEVTTLESIKYKGKFYCSDICIGESKDYKENPITTNKKIQMAMGEFTDYLQMAERFIEIQPIYYDSAKIWWLWNSKKCCWDIKDEVDLMNKLDDTMINSTPTQTSIKMQIIESLKRIGRKNKPKQPKKTWIQFQDKIIDIETNETFEASSKYFITNPLPYKLGSSDKTPTMDKIFTEWVGKENVPLLYEIISFSCLSEYFIHRLFCLVGSGLNGKGCFMEVLKKFIGNTNVISTDLDLLVGYNSSRFEITKLYKKLVCLMGETNFGVMEKTSILKRLTGQDLIGFEYKNKNPFDDHNYATIIIATNTLPATNDKTMGFYRRWCIIDFPNRFSEKKDILKDIPEIEYNNLARKSLKVLKRLWKNREFTNEGTIEDRQQKYEDKSNPLQNFLESKTMGDSEGFIPKAEFRKDFKCWCKENGFRIHSPKEIGKAMQELFDDSKKELNGNWVYSWLCLRWKNKTEKVKQEKIIQEEVIEEKIVEEEVSPDQVNSIQPEHTKPEGINTPEYILAKVKEMEDYPIEKFKEVYSESILKKLLKDGDLVENKTGFVRVV